MRVVAMPAILLFSLAVVSFAQDAPEWGATSLGQDRSISPLDRTSSTETGSISGTVVAVDGKPQFNVSVQLRDLGTGHTLASAYTNAAGRFSFDRVPYGSYELVATQQLASLRQNVALRSGVEVVSFRLNTWDPDATSSHNAMVSLAELKVPQRARDAYQKAEQAIAKHKSEDVAKYVQKALDIYPAFAPALTLRGALSLDKDDLAAAVDDFDKAIHADSSYAMAHVAMASALNRLDKFDDALRAAERASSLSPNSWQPYFEMAKSYVAKADYQRALQQLAHAQGQMSQDYAPLHLLRANVLLGLKNFNDAATELKLFLRIAPNDPNASAAQDTLGKLNAFVASAARTAGVDGVR